MIRRSLRRSSRLLLLKNRSGHSLRSFVLAPLFVLSVIFSMTACSLSLEENASVNPPLKLSGPTENCFGESLKVFEDYFKGVATPPAIDSAFTCVSGALEMFATFGRGSTNRESFSANELRAFLQQHFLGTMRLNDTMLAESMRVKQALLGGASDRLTKLEITRLTEILEIARVEAQRLRPHVRILNQTAVKAGDPIDETTLEQALSDFNYSMDALGGLLEQSKQPYHLANFETLLHEIQKLYSSRSDWSGPEWFSKQMQLIAATKALLIRPEGGRIAPDDWQLLFSHMGRIYGLYLRFNYAMKDRDLFFGDGLNQIKVGVNEVSSILEKSIRAKANGRIDHSLLHAFFDALEAGQAFELPVKASTVSNLLEPFLERILNPFVPSRTMGKRLDPADRLSAKGYRTVQGGLTTVNLGVLRDTLLGWIEMQQLWERLENEAITRDPKLQGKPIPIASVRKLWAGYSKTPYQEAWSDLKSLLDRPLPTAVYPDGRLMMVPTSSVGFDRNSFSNLNWKQQVVRTIGYGYVSDPNGLRMKGVTASQLKEVFDDFWQLTLDLKFLDKTDGDIWKTGFTISNIFLFSSNGDDRLGFHEAVDLFVFSFAASEISKEMIRPDVLATCAHGPLNDSGIPRIKPDCWRGVVRKEYQTYFESIPGWTMTVKGWGADSWNSFLGNAEKASRKKTNPSGLLMSGEMDRAISIHHYIEALYTRWDSNRDGRLSMEEADKSFFLFKNLLTEAAAAKGVEAKDARALFFYLLKYGHPPESISDKLYWLWWKKTPEEWPKDIRADRPLLMRIFGNLASSL